ncbi:glucose dehydrogenase [FAD, quinone] isoform X2 [Cephus cinctus]|uniref:Glucose dehydrogenase [FAD, quinone] isoform X2 n=1 Tax=Cephus cinctus TaxID=211228 RepID=A0AAJ7C0Q7_CEPCN|nr:glucose dehydrogenase [FAD, quinone] isoform X2 [Cephus cinctus]
MYFLKYAAFTVYGVAAFTFVYYLQLALIIEQCRDWLFKTIQNDQVYDYIVGAGSAGSVLAAKLANAKYKTLLIEAGGTPPAFFNIPILSPLFQQSVYDWQYSTVPQHHSCKGLINNQSVWPAGKILGGSSRLNYMAYVCGHAEDYADWFPDFIEPIIEKNGSLHVKEILWPTELSTAVLKGITEMGHSIRNINKELRTGFMKVQLTMKNGERWSSDQILHTKHLSTLTVITNAHVTKVLFKSNKAAGVEFVKFHTPLQSLAKKGIIISAGAIGSPKLLMLSGIGPKDHLQDLKIQIISDLPVGENLMDHILTGIDLVTLETSLSLSLVNALNPISALNYFLYGKGPWTSAGIEVVGTFNEPFHLNNTVLPNLQLMVMPIGVSQDYGIALRKAMGISDKIFQEYFAPLAYKTAVTVAPVLLHPKSTGNIKLRSNDPYDDPIIDPNYLSEQEDVQTLISGLKFVERLISTKAMKTLGASLYKKNFPGCEDEIFNSNEYWECYIRHLTLTSYHPAGTCRMGSVVDESFRVHGTENLYVVDASVLPKLPSANINAAVVALAEKASRLLIKNKNKYLRHQVSKVCYKIEVFRIRSNKR